MPVNRIMLTTNPSASLVASTRRASRIAPVASCTAVVALALWSASLAAQAAGAQVTARFGLAVPDDAYQVNCGHASLALGVDVQGRRALFPQLSLDQFTGSGGGDVACLPVAPPMGTAVGGLRLDGATRLGLGVGARTRGGPVQVEGAVLGGVITGRRGFTQGTTDGTRGFMPHLGAQASLVMFRWVVLAATVHWTRLTLDVQPAGSGAPTSRSSWSPMTTGQIGVRWTARGERRD